MDEYRIPDRFRSQLPHYSIRILEQWVNCGGDLSDFYYRLLSGNTTGAAQIADGANARAFQALCALLYDFPSECWGTPENVAAWRGLGATPTPET